jgi:hypothetical protein
MAKQGTRKKKFTTAPGILVECKSGRFLAFYEHRTDIVANGPSVIQAKKNLKQLYKDVMKLEKEEEDKQDEIDLPKDFKTARFKEKLPA